MFPKWLQRGKHHHKVSPDSPKWPRHFSCSSFKDIPNLLLDEEPSPEPCSPKLQIFHHPRSPKIQTCTNIITPKLTSSADQSSVVLYYTSLRIVRKTFEDCRTVRSILHRFRISIDERDLSMDSKFQEELTTIFGGKKVMLPKVFIGGRYIGGTEEIKKLMESDELSKVISDLPPSDGEICGMCRGWRFVLCENCNGSHKVFSEKSGFVSCVQCNVQGLLRCSSCFPVHRRRNSDFSGGLKCKSWK